MWKGDKSRAGCEGGQQITEETDNRGEIRLITKGKLIRCDKLEKEDKKYASNFQ